MNQKIVSLESLADLVAAYKAEGKTVAHCHGCFDLMHLGHIKHFEAAKAKADVLIVTLTPDRFVNKGPGRPVFSENLRMEAISALQVVDHVALNRWPTAIEMLEMVKPSFYIKGQDYKDHAQDVTGNIAKEIAAVRSVGGDVVYTEEVMFSSSKLINSHMSPLGEEVQQYLADFKGQHSVDELHQALDNLGKLKVLVIGDTIIDEYHYCKPVGKSTKSPNISTQFLRAEAYAGGVLAIANHINQFAEKVHLVTCLGTENDQMDVIEPTVSAGIETKYFFRTDGPTNTKRRYLSNYLNTKLFAVNFMNDEYIQPDLEQDIIQYLETQIPHYDLVLISDFGHGLMTPAIREFLVQSDIFVAVNAQTNSSNYGFNYITKYKNVDYISIDENELRLPFGDKYGQLEDLIHKLERKTDCHSIMITLGKKGALYYRNGEFNFAPSLATTVVDSVGAGDAVLSVSTLCALQEITPALMPFIGNCVGAVAVNIIGNERAITKTEIAKMVKHLLK